MARRLPRSRISCPLSVRYEPLGTHWIAGLDEAGRGPLAGPVVAAAVVLPADSHICGITGLETSDGPTT